VSATTNLVHKSVAGLFRTDSGQNPADPAKVGQPGSSSINIPLCRACVQNSQAQCNPFFAILAFVVDVDFYAESRVAFTLSAPYN